MIGADQFDVTVAEVAAVSAVLVAGLGFLSSALGHRKTRREAVTAAQIVETQVEHVDEKLKTGNGHTIGAGVARLEDQSWRHEQRLDRLDLDFRDLRDVLREHVVESSAFWKSFAEFKDELRKKEE